MTTTVETFKDARKKTTTVIAAEAVQAAEEQALQKLNHHVRIPGFRPGKAPGHLVKEQIKEEALVEETVRVLLPNVLKEALEKSGAKPILKPIVGVTSRDPLTITITFVEHPEITLKKGEKITVEKKKVEDVTPGDIEAFIHKILKQDRTETPVDRAAAKGDSVTLSMTAKNGKDENVPELTVNRYSVMLDGTEELIRAVAEGVVGLKKNDKKTIKATFDKDHDIPTVRGQKITIDVTVTEVSAIQLPELTDAYLKDRLRTEKTVEEFKKDVRDMLSAQRKDVEMKRREDELYEKVKASVQGEISAELVEAELEQMVNDLSAKLEQNKMSMEEWLKATGKDAKAVVAEMRDIAKSRVLLRYGMEELSTLKKISVTSEELTATLDRLQRESGRTLSDDERSEHGAAYAHALFEKKMEKTVALMIEEAEPQKV